jgi:hypothetical protein
VIKVERTPMKTLLILAAALLVGCALEPRHTVIWDEPVLPQYSPSTDEKIRELYQGYYLPAPESQPVPIASAPVESAAPEPRLPAPESQPVPQEPENLSAPVWVNTRSGVFHYPGTRWYGNTEEGKFMSGKEAIMEGDRPAMNGQ